MVLDNKDHGVGWQWKPLQLGGRGEDNCKGGMQFEGAAEFWTEVKKISTANGYKEVTSCEDEEGMGDDKLRNCHPLSGHLMSGNQHNNHHDRTIPPYIVFALQQPHFILSQANPFNFPQRSFSFVYQKRHHCLCSSLRHQHFDGYSSNLSLVRSHRLWLRLWLWLLSLLLLMLLFRFPSLSSVSVLLLCRSILISSRIENRIQIGVGIWLEHIF